MSSQYYRPYDSGSESDTESGTSDLSSDLLSELDTSDTSSYASLVNPPISGGVAAGGPDFRSLAGALNPSIAGPNFDSSGADINNSVLSLGFPVNRGGFPTWKGYEIPPDPSGNKLKTATQNITSVIMLDSRDRDRKVYPQPTNLTLRLPRQYRDVTSFSMVQIKLLSSFFYFRNDKQNTDISILELNRTIQNAAGQSIPNIIKTFIRQGTYDINSLLTELTTQLNVTPVFYDFPNGFQDFAPRFAATGDFSLNFNFPGDTYYDSLLDQFIPNPTMTLIISKYFQSQFAGLSSYTTDQIKIAYYYPVVKEVLLDENYITPLNLTLTNSTQFLLPGETPRSRCIYTFQGLNDRVVQEVIENNITTLDDYRVKHTFRYYLVNKYACSVESQSNRITIAAPSLNTSLVNLLNYKQAQFFSEQLTQNGLTQDSYNALSAQNTILLAVLNDMFYYIQRWLAYYFGINFNTFALNYIATPSNLVPIRDGSAVSGVSSNYDLNVITRNIQPTSNDILLPLRQPAKPYWNRMSNLPESTIAFPLNLETGNPATSSNYPYSLLLSQQDREHKFVDSNGYLYTNQLTRYSDIVVPLEASKYTVFQFKSPVRQTLQVETLPRPTKYRYPAYNKIAYDLSAQTLFDNSYSFVRNSQNSTMDVTATFNTSNLKTIFGFSNVQSTANFGISYASSVALWGSNQIVAQVGDTRAFYQFRTPLPTDYLSTKAAGYRYPLSITMTPSNGTFATPMNFYLYHDRGAFMADVSDVRNEKPIHYLASTLTTTTMSTATMTFPVYADQTYYILSRSSNTTIPTQFYRLNPWFPNGSSYSTLTSSLTGFNPLVDPQSPAALDNFNTAIVADPAYIRLPIQTSIQNSTTTDAQFTPLTLSSFAIGYDASGVSTDLTNYCGFIGTFPTSNFIPTAQLRMDPTSGYSFQIESAYNKVTQNYLYSNSGNAILTPNGTGVYTPKAVAARETSAVHWYGTSYLPNSLNQPPILSNLVAATYHSPFTRTTTNAALQGYTYGGSNQAIQFGDGIVGVGFVPQQGVWDIQRAMFKSVYTTSNAATDENLKIKYLGVYYSATTTNKFIHQIRLGEALAVLKFSKAVTYTSSTQNLGFDAADGTYYEFERDQTFRTGSTSYLYGYSQIRSTINTDINSIYSFIPFDQNGNFLTFQGLVGSPVPYPYYSDASAGIAYLDGTQAPAQKGIVVPRQKAVPDQIRAPPTGYDQTQSQYELSMPIGTNLLQFVQPFPLVNVANAFQPFQQLPYAPSLVVADVSGYIMTQDSYFRIFEYKADTADTSLIQKYQFTVDQVYPPTNPLINYIGVAANESEYAFFAYSNLPTPSPGTSKLLIRTMTPSNGTIKETYEFNNLPDFDPTVQTITNVTYNNFGGFTLALKAGSVVSAICKHNATTSSMTILSNADPIGFNANVDRFITRQPPKEANGNFYVFPYRYNLIGGITEGIIDFIRLTPSNLIPSQDPFYKYTGVTGQQSAWGINKPCEIQVYNLSNATGAQIFTQPIVTRQPYRDDFYMLSQTAPSSFYQITNYTASNTTQYTSNAFAQESVYKFATSASNLTQGGNGSKWSLHGATLYGNRNDTNDSPRKVAQAWQLFYPVQRIVFRQIAKNFTFMHDVSGLQYPEYPHTALVGYNTSTSMFADINKRWALEASGNFAVADFGFSGRTFNSYMFTFPLKPNTPANPNYYLAVRNYSPTEKSQVLMRFSLNNKYDFGYVSMSDISNEIVLSATASNQFTPDYYAALHAYNSNFIIGSNGQIFGANVVQGYPGSNLSNVTGFGDFYARFLALYNTYNRQVQLVQKINAAVKSNVEAFIRSDLQYILPATSLNRQRFTDPLTYTILWRSALTKEYLPLEENWGLGWNLGFDKEDTPYETVQRAQSFFKILDDFINLRMNPEFDMNRMDTGGKENLGLTLEPTGSTRAFYGKLLLANFGSFAQTFVSNPVSFTPPLGRMDRLSFNWVDITGATINNADCEWNAVIQVVEKKEVAEIGVPFLLDPTAVAKATA